MKEESSARGVESDRCQLDPFVNASSIHAMNFDDAAGYDSLKQVLADMDTKFGTKGNASSILQPRRVFLRHH